MRLCSPKNNSRIYLGLLAAYIFLTLLSAGLGYLKNMDSRIRPWDSVFYYSYLPSVFFDRDLDFTNEFGRFSNGTSFVFAHYPGKPPMNLVPVGAAILWAPLFFLAHAATLAANHFGAKLPANGFSGLYQLILYTGDSLFGLLGLWITAKFLRIYVSAAATALACLGILLASPLTHYLWPMTLSSHNLSFLAAATYLYLWSTRGASPLSAACAAVMILIRYQDGLFLAPLLLAAIGELFHRPSELRFPVGWLKKYSLFGLLLLVGLSPQILAWKALYGNIFSVPFGVNRMNWDHLELRRVLFSLHHGLFAWHPLLLAGFLGLPLLWRKNRKMALSLFLILVLEWIFNAGMTDWYGSWSFGHRRFINCLPIFALGLGLLLDAAGKWKISFGVVVVAVFALWNQLFLFQYNKGLIPHGEPVSWREMFHDKFYLVRIMAAQKCVNAAIVSLQRNDMAGVASSLKEARALNEEHRALSILTGALALQSNDANLGLRTFGDWFERDPNDLLARWSLAEFLVRGSQYARAAALFESSSSDEKEMILFAELRSKIASRAPTLIDRRFKDLYKSRLGGILNG